jgi:hypothetical protein
MKKNLLCLSGLIVIAFLFFTSCKDRITEETDQYGNKVIKEWYTKNRIKSIKTIYNVLPSDYLLVKYDKNGRLIDSARYLNDTLEGMRKFYEGKTLLLHTENYRHGMLDGIHKATFNTGVTGFEGFRKNNLMVGEWKFHFANGHPITYEYYDSTGVMKYFRKYDDNGNVLKVDGFGMIQVKSDSSPLGSNGVLSGFVEAAIPPGCTTQFIIEEIKDGQAEKKYLDITLDKPKSRWEIMFDEPGKKSLKYIITITDNKTGKIEESVSEQNLIVNPVNK